MLSGKRIFRIFPRRPQQKGGAVVTAILVVALAATTATWLLQRMDHWIESVALMREKDQATALAHAALDFCRVVLGVDARRSAIDTLDEEWARILPPLRQGDKEVSGRIADLQGRFNLNNLVLAGGMVDKSALVAYRRLLSALALPDALADALLRHLAARPEAAAGTQVEASGQSRRRLLLWGDLAGVPGYAGKAMGQLAAHATVLPGSQAINVNTAGAEVLFAVLPGLDLDAARNLTRQRVGLPFRDVAEFRRRLGDKAQLAALVDLTTVSQYFLARVQVSGARSRSELQSLLQRQPHLPQPRILWISNR